MGKNCYKDLICFGSTVNQNGICSLEIEMRLKLGRTTMEEIETIPKNKVVLLENKVKNCSILDCMDIWMQKLDSEEW